MIILYDNKEKMPWDFSFYGHEMKKSHLITGDYTIEGLETEIVIERKRSTGEISQNLGSKAKAFFSEIDRMQSIKRRYLILEFSPQDLMDFPLNSGIPKYLIPKIRINSSYLSKQIERIENEMNVCVCFCNNREQAMDKVIEILERTYEEVNGR